MGPVALLLFMGLGLCALVGLCGYLLVLKYQQQQPQREAEIMLVPLEVLQRRARNWAIAISVTLILYGLLKGIGHTAVVAIEGIEGFGDIQGFFKSQTVSGNWFIYLCTLALATYFFAMGMLRLVGHRFALWLAAPAVAFDLLISFIVAANRFGNARDGMILVMLACLIPTIVTSLLVVALNTQLLVALKTKMDERATAASGA